VRGGAAIDGAFGGSLAGIDLNQFRDLVGRLVTTIPLGNGHSSSEALARSGGGLLVGPPSNSGTGAVHEGTVKPTNSHGELFGAHDRPKVVSQLETAAATDAAFRHEPGDGF
jgi:hypothetical protein